jgi:hypothetical protein
MLQLLVVPPYTLVQCCCCGNSWLYRAGHCSTLTLLERAPQGQCRGNATTRRAQGDCRQQTLKQTKGAGPRSHVQEATGGVQGRACGTGVVGKGSKTRQTRHPWGPASTTAQQVGLRGDALCGIQLWVLLHQADAVWQDTNTERHKHTHTHSQTCRCNMTSSSGRVMQCIPCPHNLPATHRDHRQEIPVAHLVSLPPPTPLSVTCRLARHTTASPP